MRLFWPARLYERLLRWYRGIAPRTQQGVPLTLYLTPGQHAVLKKAARLDRAALSVFVTRALSAGVAAVETKVPLKLVGEVALAETFAAETHPCAHFRDKTPPNYKAGTVPGSCAKRATGRCDYYKATASNCNDFDALVPLRTKKG